MENSSNRASETAPTVEVGRTSTSRRIFVAAQLPVELRALARAQGEACVERLGGRAVPAENLHVTLAFLGSVPDCAVSELSAALRHDLTGCSGARVGVGGVVARPSGARARLLALELTDPDGALAHLADRVSGAAARSVRAFQPAASQAFWPHITLVRFSRPIPVRRSPPRQSEHVFDISRVALYDSHIARGGPPRYDEVLGITLSTTPQRSPSNG